MSQPEADKTQTREPKTAQGTALALIITLVVGGWWAFNRFRDLDAEAQDLASSEVANSSQAGSTDSNSNTEPTVDPLGDPTGEPTVEPTVEPTPFSEDLIAAARDATWVDGDGEEVTVGDRSDPQGYVGFEEGIEAEGGVTVNALVTRPAPDGTLVGTVMLAEPLAQGARLHGQVGFGRVKGDLFARFTMTALFRDGRDPAVINFIDSDTVDNELRDPFDYNLSEMEGATAIVLQMSDLTVDAADPLWIDLSVDGLR